VTAVDGVSFHVDPGETLADRRRIRFRQKRHRAVGASADSESTGRIESGEILFDGVDLLKLDDPGIRSVRGNKIAMIFQEPMSSLNPALTVGLQVAEPINVHRGTPWEKAY